MRTEYVLEVHCRCPVDGRTDFYTLTLRAARTVPVESILEAVGRFEGQKLYQEDFTRGVQGILGGEVETTGYHSGVFTRVTEGSR